MKTTFVGLIRVKVMSISTALFFLWCGEVYSVSKARIFEAIEEGNVELVLNLARDGQMEKTNQNGNTPLLVAALNGNLEMVRTLVENGADIMHRDRNGNTIINIMASLCARTKERMEKHANDLREIGFSEETIDKLLSSSAFPEKYKGKEKQFSEIHNYLKGVMDDRRAELLKAIEAGDIIRVQRLAQITPLDERAVSGRTPLMCAALDGNMDMVRVLLDAGASTAIRDYDGFSVAMAMETILMARCDVEKNENRSLNDEQISWYKKVVKEIGEPSETRLKQYRIILNLIVSREKPSASLNSSRDPSLFKAIAKGNIEEVRLLAGQSNLEEKNSDDITPLMFAALYGYHDVTKALIDAGARLDTRGREGKTVIELLETIHGKWQEQICKAKERLHSLGMTDSQIDDAIAAGRRLPGYPSIKQLQRINQSKKVLEYLKGIEH